MTLPLQVQSSIQFLKHFLHQLKRSKLFTSRFVQKKTTPCLPQGVPYQRPILQFRYGFTTV